MADELNTNATTPIDTASANPPAKTPVSDPTVLTKEQQEHFDKVIAGRAKEAADKERKRLLKEFGIKDEEIDDPKAIESVKGKITNADKLEKEKLSDIEKANLRAEEAEAKVVAAEAKAAQIAAERLADKVDNKLRTLAKGVNEKVATADDVVDWLRLKKRAEVEKLVGDDGNIDEKAAEKLVADFRKDKPSWFAVTSGVSSPSVSGGRPLEPETADRKRAQAHSQRTIRG
jgi:hypothetical protein